MLRGAFIFAFRHLERPPTPPSAHSMYEGCAATTPLMGKATPPLLAGQSHETSGKSSGAKPIRERNA